VGSANATEIEAEATAGAEAEAGAEIETTATTTTKTTSSVVQKWRPSRRQTKTASDVAIAGALIEKVHRTATPTTNPPAPKESVTTVAANVPVAHALRQHPDLVPALSVPVPPKARTLTRPKTCPRASMAEVIPSLNAVMIRLLTKLRTCLVVKALPEDFSSALPATCSVVTMMADVEEGGRTSGGVRFGAD